MPSTVRTPKESLRLMHMSCHTYIAASKWRHNWRQMDTIYYWKKFWRGRKQGCLTQTPSLENTGNIACVEASLSPKTYRDRELEIASFLYWGFRLFATPAWKMMLEFRFKENKNVFSKHFKRMRYSTNDKFFLKTW